MCTLGILYFAKLFSPGQEYGMHKSIYAIFYKKPPILLFPRTGKKICWKTTICTEKKIAFHVFFPFFLILHFLIFFKDSV